MAVEGAACGPLSYIGGGNVGFIRHLEFPDRRRVEVARRAHERQQTPYRCQSRNQGLFASISSCLRFAAARSLRLSGRLSGTAKMRSSHSISAMVCSASIRQSSSTQRGCVKRYLPKGTPCDFEKDNLSQYPRWNAILPFCTWKKPHPRKPFGSRHSRIAHSPS